MLSVLVAIYQFEREMVLERQREGIAKAQQAGRYRANKTALTDKPSGCLDKKMSIRRTADY